jgi:TrmH family RNA methyltransferase
VWASLSKRSVRDAEGRFLIEGSRETERAIGNLTLDEVIWCPDYGAVPEVGRMPITTVSIRVFDKISRRQNPDGVAAVAVTPDVSLAGFNPSGPALVLVADAIEKPGNIGAILRSCDAFGAAFVGSSLETDIVNPNVVRAAQGSLFATNLACITRSAAIEWAIEHSRIFVAHPYGAESLWDQNLTGSTAIVVGSEHSGVDSQWLDVGTPVVIPMTGVADSLNASVSAGVFLAEAARQRSV